MGNFEPKAGAYVNSLSLIMYYRHYGIHPSVMPWQFLNKTTKELLGAFQDLGEDDLETAPF